MANVEQQDAQPVGITYDEAERGAFIKNCYQLPPNTWKVREGFGRVYSYNTSYGQISLDQSNITPVEIGYVKHLGSIAFNTSFGNRQILSLYIASVSSLNRDGTDGLTVSSNIYNSAKQDVISEHSYQYVVVIYDIDTNRHYEQIISAKTSEIEDIIPMEAQYGFYDRDLAIQTNNKVFPIDPNVDEPFYSAELNSPTGGDVIYFGTNILGLYAYRPAVFDAPPDIQVETTFLGAKSYTFGGQTGRVGWSETGIIERATAGTGLLAGSFVYLNASEFPVPTDITVINNRLAMAYGKQVYFSDTFNGSAIIADNILDVPSDKEITAISEINGVLLIWTPTETFMYQPSVGTQIQTAGRTIKINNTFGCDNAQSHIKVESRCYWTNATGIYVSDGMKVQDIADPVRPIFRKFIETPLTVYDRASPNGYTDLSRTQVQIQYDWKKVKGLHFAKNTINNLVYLVVPEQNFAFVIDEDNMFSIWSWETSVTNQATVAGATYTDISGKSILNDDFRLVDISDDLFIVNLTSPVEMSSGAWRSELVGLAKTSRMAEIFRWKVAGGTDFSMSYHEDKKTYVSSTRLLSNPAGDETAKPYKLVIGKPVPIYDGIISDKGNIYGNTNSELKNTPWFLVPVGVSTFRSKITSFKVKLDLNLNFWKVGTFSNGGVNYVDVIWHPNRLASADNFGWTAPVVGVRDVSLQGTQLWIDYDGAANPTYFGNYLNVNEQVQTLFWIPMTMKLSPFTPLASSTFGQAWTLISEQFNGVGGKSVIAVEEFGSFVRDSEKGEYPIEWIIQSEVIKGEKGELLKARGGFINVLSDGPYPNVSSGPNALATNYVTDRGLINAMVSSDYNDYQGQVIDFTMNPPAIQDGMINVLDVSQGEFTDTAGQQLPKVFNQTGATYANMSPTVIAPMAGSILIDGEDYMDTSFSTSTKGTGFQITLYGYAQNIATRLLVKRFNAAFRAISEARRRWKHNKGDQ